MTDIQQTTVHPDNQVWLAGHPLTAAQHRVERAHRQADQLLMKTLAETTWYDTESFNVFNNLTATNVAECVRRLRRAGHPANADDLFDDIAHRFAERFAHYWPALDERISNHARAFSRTLRSLDLESVG